MSSEHQEHIERLQSLINNKDMLSRLPDGGQKLRERLDSLLSMNNNNNNNANQDGAAAATNQTQQQQKTTTTTTTTTTTWSSSCQEDGELISKNGGTTITTRPHQNVLMTAPASKTRPKTDNDGHKYSSLVEASIMKNFGEDFRLGRLETIRLCRGISDEEAMKHKNSVSVTVTATAKPLHIMDWEETGNAHDEMLEEERREALRKIRKRMELFVDK